MTASMTKASKMLASSGSGQFVNSALGKWTIRIVTLSIILVTWEIKAANINRALLAPPSEIFEAAYDQMFVSGTVWAPFLDSMWVLVTGLTAAILVGLPIGVAMGRWKRVSWALDPYVTFFYALPHVTLVPAMIIMLGFQYPFRFGYVVLSAVWPVIINTRAGVRAVEPDLIDVGVAYMASERQIIRRIILPAASPFMVAGGRQAFSAAWSGVIVSEITSTLVGIGGQIKLYSIDYLTADMFVPIFFIAIVAIWIQAFAAWAQRKLTPWKITSTSR